MESLYKEDLAYIQATAFGGLARGAAKEIVRLLKSASIEIRKVVDLGCGAGPLSAALVQAGFEVTGIDSSVDLVAMAQAEVPKTRFVNESIYDAEIPTCEAVVALGEPLTYHPDDALADRLVQSLFQKVSVVLPAGGVFIFDIIELGEPPLAGRAWSSGEDWAVLVDTQEDQQSRVLIRNIETFRRVDQCYRHGCETHGIRLFDTAGLCEQLASCGFATETKQSYGAQRLAPRRRSFLCTRLERSLLGSGNSLNTLVAT